MERHPLNMGPERLRKRQTHPPLFDGNLDSGSLHLQQVLIHRQENKHPNLTFLRHDLSEHPAIIPEVRCMVGFEGSVLCVVSASQDAFCKVDSTRFPFDVQNCTLRIGSWVHSGEQLSIDLSNPAISLEDYKDNGEYKLIKATAVKNVGKYKCCPNDTYPSLMFTFTMKRSSGVLVASVFIPALGIFFCCYP